jgi:hypothetical protein
MQAPSLLSVLPGVCVCGCRPDARTRCSPRPSLSFRASACPPPTDFYPALCGPAKKNRLALSRKYSNLLSLLAWPLLSLRARENAVQPWAARMVSRNTALYVGGAPQPQCPMLESSRRAPPDLAGSHSDKLPPVDTGKRRRRPAACGPAACATAVLFLAENGVLARCLCLTTQEAVNGFQLQVHHHQATWMPWTFH